MLALIGGYSIAQLVIFVIIAAAVIAILFIALRQFGIAIPPWAVNVFWVIVVAFVCIAAVRLIMSM